MGVRKTKKNRTSNLIRVSNIWDKACRLILERSSPNGLYAGPIERGVNYFVLMLEQLGATTYYSCEGHPNGFYIVFKAPLKIARNLAACGYFSIEITGDGLWRLSMRPVDTHAERRQILRWAAASWEKRFGPLTVFGHA